MSKISVELPVKLEELCQFTFNFNNLIKIIDYLHQNNLSLQEELKDIDKRLISMENLKTDIDDLKIKTTNIERTNDNINRSLSNIHENVLKFDSKISDFQAKINDVESKVKNYEIIQNEHIQNINHLNKVADDNKKNIAQLNDSININSKNTTKIIDKLEEHEKSNKEEFEKINNNIKEINALYEKDHKEIEDINNNIGDINESITNLMNDFEKKNSEMNSRIINIISDVANINNNISNMENINTNVNNLKNENEASPNIINAINKDMNNSNLFKIAMDEIEEEKNKFNKFKDDYEIYKDKQKRENDTIKKNISEIINEFTNLKKEVDENAENIEKIENNYNNYINIKYEEAEGEDKSNKNKSIDLNHLSNYLNSQLSKYVRFDVFKKLNDNVRIISSTINSKTNQEEIEKVFKKFNERLERVEMIQQGITYGPKTRIDLGLVNMKYESGTNVSGDHSNVKEIDYIIKTVEKKIKGNLIDIINKEINNNDFSLNPKINELIINNNKNSEDINKDRKDILDIKNILITNPSQNDFIKLKTEFDNILEEIKTNRLKIIELTKNIEGTEEEDDSADNDEENKNILKGTIKDKIKFLNKTCQNLNVKLNNLEVKHKSMTKEVKDGIKQNLKIETVKIMQQFKQRLETFTTKFESELKNKIDQIGLSDFETKINNRLYYDLKEKLDKNELKKNNNMMKRKIEGLENKISKTLVDTIIDLQMDDQPLIVKKNGNGLDICASCNQPKPRNTIYESGERDFYPINIKNVNRVKNMNKTFINYTQGSNNNNKSNSNNNDKSFNLNLSLGQNKLPEIIPSLHQK